MMLQQSKREKVQTKVGHWMNAVSAKESLVTYTTHLHFTDLISFIGVKVNIFYPVAYLESNHSKIILWCFFFYILHLFISDIYYTCISYILQYNHLH